MPKATYKGGMEEALINRPQQMVFKRGESEEVTEEMAKALLANPDFEVKGVEQTEEPEAAPEPEADNEPTEGNLRAELEAKCDELGWKSFQKWAKEKYGATDTSKSELFDEIIQKVESEGGE